MNVSNVYNIFLVVCCDMVSIYIRSHAESALIEISARLFMGTFVLNISIICLNTGSCKFSIVIKNLGGVFGLNITNMDC